MADLSPKRLLFCAITVVIALVRIPEARSAADAGLDQIISANPLLAKIHQRNPDRAAEFVDEISRMLAKLKAEQGDKAHNNEGVIFRGSPGGSGAHRDLSKSDKQAIRQNPILKDLYMRSPVASLRMLERMREATGKN